MKGKHAMIGIASIILGLLVSFVLTPFYGKVLEKKGKVVRVKKLIEAGRSILNDNLEVVEVGTYNLSDKVIQNKEDVISKYAKTDLYPGMYVTKESLSENLIEKDLYLNNIPEDKYAVSITVHTFASGLSSKLRKGDVVSILIRQTLEDGKISCVVPESLMYVEILSATESTGKDKETLETKEEKENKELATVTLLVNKEQATELTVYEPDSSLHLALKCRNDEKRKQELLDIQDKYFESFAQELQEVNQDMINDSNIPEIDNSFKNQIDKEITNSNTHKIVEEVVNDN